MCERLMLISPKHKSKNPTSPPPTSQKSAYDPRPRANAQQSPSNAENRRPSNQLKVNFLLCGCLPPPSGCGISPSNNPPPDQEIREQCKYRNHEEGRVPALPSIRNHGVESQRLRRVCHTSNHQAEAKERAGPQRSNCFRYALWEFAEEGEGGACYRRGSRSGGN